jgi:hypothetical protein
VALSGTLDSFALPDVLRLLATTAKSGRLRITGDRGSGSVWVDDGDVVATELTASNGFAPNASEVIFGLLRFDAGSFTFESGARAAHADHPNSMEPILAQAENMLAEWRSIEEVVPSLEVWVGLVAELNGPDVMIDANRWCCIAAVGSGAQVGAVAETLELSEIEACRTVKELIELGLVQIVDEPVGASVAAAPVLTEPLPVLAEDTEEEPSMVDEMLSGAFDDQPIGGVDAPAFDSPADIDEPMDSDESEAIAEPLLAEMDSPALAATDDDVSATGEDDHSHDPNTVPSLASLEPSEGSIDPLLPAADPLTSGGDLFVGTIADEADTDDLNPAEMARQLANLSPKAAKAVAAAAKASTDAERDAALAAVEAEDDTVNRGLLLKFLGSVDS